MRLAWVLIGVATLAFEPARAAELQLRQVVLTLGGVATMIYEAPAPADGVANLEVRRADVDDVLKSLVILGGASHVGSLRLAGPDGRAAAFAGLPFPPAALTDSLALLNGMRGVPVEVRDPTGREVVLSGRMLGAARRREPASGMPAGIDRTRVSLLTPTGLREFVLEEQGPIAAADPALQADIDAALASLRGQATDERRRIRIQVDGGGGPTLRLAVVTAAPLWRASYRLVQPDAAIGHARLQGWAVLENLTAADWTDVAVTLRSGNPVTFRSPLYRPALVERPEIPVLQQERLLPEPDRRSSPSPGERAFAPIGQAADAPLAMAPPPAPAPAMPAAPPDLQAATATEAVAATDFALPDKLSLPVGETASVPFLDAEVPAEAIDLLAYAAPHPLATLRIRNTTGSGLPPGPVATFDATAFAGDARLPPLPAGETRLLTFAEDLAVTATWSNTDAQDITRLAVAQGVAHLVRRQRSSHRIELAGAIRDKRTVLIALPRLADATLSVTGGASHAEDTADTWRLRVDLAAGQTETVTALVDQFATEDVALTDNPDAALTLLDVQALDPRERAALRHIEELRHDETAGIAARDAVAARRAEIATGEERLRANLAAVPATDPLHQRLLRQLDAAETHLDALADDLRRATEAVQSAHAALAAAIASLSIGA